jgi:hypothetical protein
VVTAVAVIKNVMNTDVLPAKLSRIVALNNVQAFSA